MNDTDLEVLSTPALIEEPVIIEVEKEQHNNDLMNLFIAFPAFCLSICLGLSIFVSFGFVVGSFLYVLDCTTYRITLCRR